MNQLSPAAVRAVCMGVVEAVNTAVAHQFALPSEVLGHLVACQTDAYRARHFAARPEKQLDVDAERALSRYLAAASKLQRELERLDRQPSLGSGHGAR